MISRRTDVRGLGIFAQSDGTLVDNVQDLKERLTSMRDEAYARIKTSGSENIGVAEGTRIGVEFDYINGESPVAVKYAKLSLATAKRAVLINSQGRYLCTDSTRRYDTSRKTADREEKAGLPHKERTAIVLPRENFNMSPSENPNHFAFFLEDLAEKGEDGKVSYLVLNKGNPIAVYLIDKEIVDGKRDSQLLENPNGTIVVPYGWFRSLDDRSELLGFGRIAGNCDGYRARGVLDAPKAPQKVSKCNSLDYKVQDAIRNGKSFEYNGVIYVAVRDGRLSLKQ